MTGDIRLLLDRPALKKFFRARRRRVAGGRRRRAQRLARPAGRGRRSRRRGGARNRGREGRARRAAAPFRPASSTAPSPSSRRQPVRGDLAARGRGDLRPPRQGRLRTRLVAADAERRDFTINALSVDATARSTTMSAASTISTRGGCASSAIRDSASPKTICASCASSASTPRMAKAAIPTPQGFAACIAGRGGLDQLSRERLGGGIAETLSFPRSAAIIETMSQAGLLAFLDVAPWPARCLRLAAILSARNQSRFPAFTRRAGAAQRQ